MAGAGLYAGRGAIRVSDGRRVVFVGRIAEQVAGRADVLPGRALYGCRMAAGWCLWEGLPDRLPDVPMCCRAGRYTGVGWSPQRVVGGAECVGGQDCPRGRLDDCRARTGMAAAGYSRLFRVSGCCRTTTGATGPPFSCRALGAVTRPFPRQAAAGSPPCSACGAVRGKSSRV